MGIIMVFTLFPKIGSDLTFDRFTVTTCDCVVFNVHGFAKKESSNRQKMKITLFFCCQAMSHPVKKISCEQSGMK